MVIRVPMARLKLPTLVLRAFPLVPQRLVTSRSKFACSWRFKFDSFGVSFPRALWVDPVPGKSNHKFKWTAITHSQNTLPSWILETSKNNLERSLTKPRNMSASPRDRALLYVLTPCAKESGWHGHKKTTNKSWIWNLSACCWNHSKWFLKASDWNYLIRLFLTFAASWLDWTFFKLFRDCVWANPKALHLAQVAQAKIETNRIIRNCISPFIATAALSPPNFLAGIIHARSPW